MLVKRRMVVQVHMLFESHHLKFKGNISDLGVPIKMFGEKWNQLIPLSKIKGNSRDPQQCDPLMGSFPYYSHTTPIRIPKGMGMVWEAYHKGGPIVGGP